MDDLGVFPFFLEGHPYNKQRSRMDFKGLLDLVHASAIHGRCSTFTGVGEENQ